MAKVTKIIEHDWLAVRVTFGDGTKANVTWNRGGEKVSLAPFHSGRAETLSLIVKENLSKLGKGDYPFADLGQTADAMERVAKNVATIDEYLEHLKTVLQVTAERPRPKAAANAPQKTVASVRKSRGWVVDAFFPTGEKVELKINGSSVGLRIDPDIPSKSDEIMRFAFGIKQSGLMDDESLARAIKAAADEAADIDEWLVGMRAAVIGGGPRPR
jgi:hypothetical protein